MDWNSHFFFAVKKKKLIPVRKSNLFRICLYKNWFAITLPFAFEWTYLRWNGKKNRHPNWTLMQPNQFRNNTCIYMRYRPLLTSSSTSNTNIGTFYYRLFSNVKLQFWNQCKCVSKCNQYPHQSISISINIAGILCISLRHDGCFFLLANGLELLL